MKKIFAGLMLTAISCSPLSSNLYAADGKAIYSKNCTGCHGTEIFARPDRKVKNKPDLHNRVRQCSYAIEAKWFDEQITSVADYLNKDFYKFQ